MKTPFTAAVVLTSVAGIVLIGCSSPYGYSDYTQETVVVSGPPPVERQVIVTAPPRTVVEPPTTVVTTPSTVSTRPGYVWVDGNWNWKANGWEWQEGHWARQPYRDARWVAGHYSYQDGRHVYVPGYWTK